ncbi:unnamed protein product [Pleuronectes platessa]|uniref:Uncharacterized protein n=1 Tax=Pleuronectes platessa TaxID=8262 RepID=A0A9N7YMY7_PLEPL|nr:unnamed protein product [Pleuronectes platessa]
MDIRRFFSRGDSSAQSDEREKQETDRAEGTTVADLACAEDEAKALKPLKAATLVMSEEHYRTAECPDVQLRSCSSNRLGTYEGKRVGPLEVCNTSLVNHHKFQEAQSKLGLTAVELVQLSNTRWACQLRSINAILETLPAIFECLSAIGSPLAVGVKAQLYKFSTVYSLLMFQTLLSVTEGLHKFLQKETLDLAEAFISKQAVCDTLRGKCTDVFATELYERTKALCHTHSIPQPDAKKRHKQRKMEDFVLETTFGSGTELISSQTLKAELLFPCVDRMVSELELRFSSVDAGLLKGIQACSPKSENFMSESHLDELAKHYSIDLKTEEDLAARNFLARKTEAGCPPQDMLAVHNLLDSDMFPSLKAII